MSGARASSSMTRSASKTSALRRPPSIGALRAGAAGDALQAVAQRARRAAVLHAVAQVIDADLAMRHAHDRRRVRGAPRGLVHSSADARRLQAQAAQRRPERGGQRLRSALARRKHVHGGRVQRTREGRKAERPHPVARVGELGDAAARQPAGRGKDLGARAPPLPRQRGAVQRKRLSKRRVAHSFAAQPVAQRGKQGRERLVAKLG
jgi:hypothetical protein